MADKIAKLFKPPATKLGGGGGILDSPCLSVRPSVLQSVSPSVCPLTFRVRPVASTVQDGLFPYLVQTINSMRGCVAYDDPWPWPISSRSFGLDFENRVCSVTFSVLNRLFPYLPQIIIRGCVTCKVYNKIIKFQFFTNFSAFTLKKKQFCLHSFHIWHKSSLYPRPTKLEGGYTGFTLSVRPSVRPSVRLSVDDMVSGA